MVVATLMFAPSLFVPFFGAMPLPMVGLVANDPPFVAPFDDDRCGRCVPLNHNRSGCIALDDDGRWSDGGTDETTYDAPEKTAEGRIGVVGKRMDGQSGEGRTSANSDNRLFHLVTSSVCESIAVGRADTTFSMRRVALIR
jgi:hypothetical protein